MRDHVLSTEYLSIYINYAYERRHNDGRFKVFVSPLHSIKTHPAIPS